MGNKVMNDSPVHVVIPDLQVKPGAPTAHLRWIGQYLVDKWAGNDNLRIIQIGDFADMPSLSSYDRKGGKLMEGRRYSKDVESVHAANEILLGPMAEYNKGRRVKWNPGMDLTLGNHEQRIVRSVDQDAQLEGLVDVNGLAYDEYGWNVHDFLVPVNIDGVTYSHYFANPMNGRPYGGQSIDTRIKTIGFTFTMGHQQGLQIGRRHLNNGAEIRGLVAGSCYLHDEDYAGPQGNNNWRGIVVCHGVEKGSYNLMEVPLDYLCRRYEGQKLKSFLQRGKRH